MTSKTDFENEVRKFRGIDQIIGFFFFLAVPFTLVSSALVVISHGFLWALPFGLVLGIMHRLALVHSEVHQRVTGYAYPTWYRWLRIQLVGSRPSEKMSKVLMLAPLHTMLYVLFLFLVFILFL